MNKQKLSEIHKRTWTPFFEAILRGDKNGEVRLNDFDVQSGDTLVLDEWNPNTGYTGRSIKRKVRAVFPVDFHQFHTDEEIREHGHLYIELENPRIAEAEKLALALDSPDGLLVNGMKRIIPELSKMLLKALRGGGESEPCHAVLYHGGGHQSKTQCEKTGEHIIHYASYGSGGVPCYWKGKEATTGYFDEPPEGQDELEREAGAVGEERRNE